jgi:hypothetical protein
MKGISIITNSMSIGDQSRVTISVVSSVVAPVNASNWLNILEDAMISNIILVMKADVPKASTIIEKDSLRYAAAVISEAKTPVAAASDGVAIPNIIKPITEKIMMANGKQLTMAVSFSDQLT